MKIPTRPSLSLYRWRFFLNASLFASLEWVRIQGRPVGSSKVQKPWQILLATKTWLEHIEPGSSENILKHNSIILQSIAVLFLDSNEAAIRSSLRLLSLNSLPLSFLHKWLTDVSHSGEQPVRCCQAQLLPYMSNMCVSRYGERMCFT